MTRVLCHPCYRAIRDTVLAQGGSGLLEDISIETAMRFAADPRYAAAYASHRCKGGACVCVCHASSSHRRGLRNEDTKGTQDEETTTTNKAPGHRGRPLHTQALLELYNRLGTNPPLALVKMGMEPPPKAPRPRMMTG